MTKKNIIFSITSSLLGALLCCSCLKYDLPDYPLSNLNAVSKVYFEYRYLSSTTNVWNQPSVSIKNNLATSQVIRNDTVFVNVTIPATSGDFTATEKAKVTKSTLWCSMDISQAATIVPVEKAPKLGYEGDFSVPRQYVVTAANGDKCTWTVVISKFSNN